MGKRERSSVDQGNLLAFDREGHALMEGEAGERGQEVLDRAKHITFVGELGGATFSRGHTKG